jgi:pimeloyl-ACP methyl ester carboxylesterase
VLRRLALAAVVVAAVVIVVRSAPQPPPGSSLLGAMGRGPTVVLVHGLGSSARHWFPLARDLARDHRVAFVELPGHGLAPMSLPFTLEQAALALDRALAEESREPVVLVGHSAGGLVAAAEALRAPWRVRALVLVESALAPQLPAAERAAFLDSLDRDWEATLRDVYRGFGRDSLQGEALWAEASHVERARMRAWIPVALSADLSAAVAGLAMPVLAVLAPHSWQAGETWEQAARALGYSRIRRLEAERVEDCGHFVMLDQPARLAAAIRRCSATRDSALALR